MLLLVRCTCRLPSLPLWNILRRIFAREHSYWAAYKRSGWAAAAKGAVMCVLCACLVCVVELPARSKTASSAFSHWDVALMWPGNGGRRQRQMISAPPQLGRC
ncbi:hypothetical protein GQ54DRAFT_158348 [Martensiomyces pterosporus]|nr:hypothetical protein GQ54DRAFT_158348 [Martensiomyces pterosporus]